MAWLAKYTIEFKSTFRGDTYKAMVYQSPTATNADKDPPQAQPLVLKVKAQDESLEAAIRGSELIMKMYSDTDYEFMELFTANSKKYKVQYQINGDMIWYGWIVPELYSEPHQPIEYPVAIQATDGLGLLKKYDWKNGDVNFSGKQEILQTILDILARTEIDVQVYDSSYIYESHHNDNNNVHSPLKQTYFDAEVFIEAGKPKNCYEVLEALLRRFHLTIRHYDSYFHIIQINAQKTAYTRRLYTLAGAYVSYQLYDPEILVTATSEPKATFLGWVDDWATTTIERAWKKLVIKQDYGLHNNLLNENFFYGGSFPNAGDAYERYNSATKKLYLLPRRGQYEYDGKFIYSSLGYISTDENQVLNIKITVDRIGKIIGKIILYVLGASSVRYLNDNGVWYGSEKTLWDSTEQSVGTLEFLSDPVPISGYIIMQYHVHAVEGPENIQARDIVVNIGASEISIIDYDNTDLAEELEITTDIDEDNNHIEEYDTLLGDIPILTNNNLIYWGGLYYGSGGDYIPTGAWRKKTISTLGSTGSLNDIISDEICINHVVPNFKREGTLMGMLNATNIITESGVKFMVINCDSDHGEDTHSIILLQLSGSLTDGAFLKLKSSGYLKLKSGGKIKLKGRNK